MKSREWSPCLGRECLSLCSISGPGWQQKPCRKTDAGLNIGGSDLVQGDIVGEQPHWLGTANDVPSKASDNCHNLPGQAETSDRTLTGEEMITSLCDLHVGAQV